MQSLPKLPDQWVAEYLPEGKVRLAPSPKARALERYYAFLSGLFGICLLYVCVTLLLKRPVPWTELIPPEPPPRVLYWSVVLLSGLGGAGLLFGIRVALSRGEEWLIGPDRLEIRHNSSSVGRAEYYAGAVLNLKTACNREKVRWSLEVEADGHRYCLAQEDGPFWLGSEIPALGAFLAKHTGWPLRDPAPLPRLSREWVITSDPEGTLHITRAEAVRCAIFYRYLRRALSGGISAFVIYGNSTGPWLHWGWQLLFLPCLLTGIGYLGLSLWAYHGRREWQVYPNSLVIHSSLWGLCRTRCYAGAALVMLRTGIPNPSFWSLIVEKDGKRQALISSRECGLRDLRGLGELLAEQTEWAFRAPSQIPTNLSENRLMDRR